MYVHSMYLDDDAPIAGGRELWGFPKKLASPALAIDKDTLIGTLDYGRVRVATATMGYKHRALDIAASGTRSDFRRAPAHRSHAWPRHGRPRLPDGVEKRNAEMSRGPAGKDRPGISCASAARILALAPRRGHSAGGVGAFSPQRPRASDR